MYYNYEQGDFSEHPLPYIDSRDILLVPGKGPCPCRNHFPCRYPFNGKNRMLRGCLFAFFALRFSGPLPTMPWLYITFTENVERRAEGVVEPLQYTTTIFAH